MHLVEGNMEKQIVDGKVAVVFSPGFGAGWYTWNRDCPEIIFDPAIVKLVLEEKYDELETFVTLKYPQLYIGGLEDLAVKYIPQGVLFRINEYDGSESVEILDTNKDWMIA